ncbi:hypothetical protein KAK07_06635 [Ideonella sp. 4Y16]|uniref:hypothetical protein n=1 Tax=Ideonella alba TaxID=2824118 RepID=UPI001B39C0DF|nr:hypothetical protein [Ideonella alba]MBQ0943005.1 hypothetical protein [Ideonella alba]
MSFLVLILMVGALSVLRQMRRQPALLAGAGARWRLAARAVLVLGVLQPLYGLWAWWQWALSAAQQNVPWPMLLASQAPQLLVAAVCAWGLWQDWQWQRSLGANPEATLAPLTPERAIRGLGRGLVMGGLVLLMAGFGLCGGMGVLAGVSDLVQGVGDGLPLIGLGAIGLLIAWWLGVRAFRSDDKEDR